MNVGLYVASNEIGSCDQISRTYRAVAETKVRGCKTARLLGVVSEIGLAIFVRCRANDFDGVLVGSNGSV